MIAKKQLLALADKCREAYASADPFPHIVIDDFLPEAVLDRVRAEIPRPEDIRWLEFDDARGKKLASKAEPRNTARLNGLAAVAYRRAAQKET